MMAGRVVRIRVNPKDCMSVVDAISKIGLSVKGMSFSQAVSIALSSALESFRQNGVVPERDGFEYSEMMKQFPEATQSSRAQALGITKAISFGKVSVPAVLPASREMLQAQIRLDELLVKAEGDPLNMTQELKDEMEKLTELLTGRSRG